MFDEGVAAFVAEAGRLDADGWSRPACGEWTATELARHVLSVIGWYHDWLDRAEAGDPSPAFPVDELDERTAGRSPRWATCRGPRRPPASPRRRRATPSGSEGRGTCPTATHAGTVTAGLHAGLACFEWHAHTWDLATSPDDHVPSRPDRLYVAAADCLAAATGADAGEERAGAPVGGDARAVGSAMTIERGRLRPRRGRARTGTRSSNASIERRHGLPAGCDPRRRLRRRTSGPAAVTGALDYEHLGGPGRRAGRLARGDRGVGRVPRPRRSRRRRAGRRRCAPAGCRVGLLSNATTRLEEDLAVLGLDATFDVVFNTARLGVCKPDHEVYRRVVDALGVPADHIVFTDDTPSWAEAATEVGLHGIPFTGVTHLRDELQPPRRPLLNLEGPPGGRIAPDRGRLDGFGAGFDRFEVDPLAELGW